MKQRPLSLPTSTIMPGERKSEDDSAAAGDSGEAKKKTSENTKESQNERTKDWLKEKCPEQSARLCEYAAICLNTAADVSGIQCIKLFGAVFQILENIIEGKEQDSCNYGITADVIKVMTPIQEGIDALINLHLQSRFEKFRIIFGELDTVNGYQKENVLSTMSPSYDDTFRQNLTVFEKSNLDNLIGHFMEQKCQETYDQLYKFYYYICTSRFAYIYVMLIYINSRTSTTKDEKERLAALQFESYEKDSKIIDDCFTAAYWPFHPIRKLKELKEQGVDFDPKPVPVVDETPKKTRYYSFKDGKGSVSGKAFELDNGYMCFESKETMKYGKRTIAKYTKKYLYPLTLKLAPGPATIETDAKYIIGTLDKNGIWTGGKISKSKESGAIQYKEYDDYGKLIPGSTLHYHRNEWVSVDQENPCEFCC